MTQRAPGALGALVSPTALGALVSPTALRALVSPTALLVLALVLATACGHGAAPPPAAHATGLPHAPGPIDALARRFGRLRTRMRDRGARGENGPFRTFVAPGAGTSVPLDLPTDVCTTFVALGGGTLRDVVLALHDGDGEEVARDDSDGEGGVVHVCPTPPAPGARVAPYHLVVLATHGEGALLVSSFTSAQHEAPAFDGLYDGLLAPRTTSDVAVDRLADARDALRARHLAPLSQPVVSRLAEGDAARTSVRLGADHCYTAVARGEAGVRDIDLFLFDAAGAEVARDLAENAEPALTVCPETEGAYTLEARAFRGAGAIAVQVLAGPRDEAPTPPEAAPSPPAASPDEAVRALVAPLVARGFGAPIVVVADGDIAPGEVRAHEVPATAGCVVILGVPGGDATDFDLYVDGADGRELGRDTGVDASAHVGTCLDGASTLRVTMKAYGRRGRYSLAVLRAPEDVHDLAALRLDEASAPFRARGYVPSATRSFALAEGHSFREEVALAAGRCVAVAAGGSADVTDVDVTLRDHAGTLVARDTRPAPEAAVSRCATEADNVTVEVVAYRGGGTVLATVLEGAP